MVRKPATTLLTTLLLSGIAGHALALSMQEAVEHAIATHPDVKIAEKNRDAIEHQIRQARGGYYPKVDVAAGTGWEHSNNTTTRNRAGRVAADDGHRDLFRNESRLSVTQMLFDGFQTRSDVAEQRNRYTSAQYNMLENKEIIALRALEAYLNMLRTRELVALGQTNYDAHVSYGEQIRKRVDAGRGSQADYRQAEGRVALAQANLIAFKGDMETATADFIEAVGMQPEKVFKSKTPFTALPGNVQDAVDIAVNSNPAIKSAQADIEAAEAAVAEAMAACCPRITLEGGVSRNVNLDGVEGTNNDAFAMLFLRHNLYNGGADTARIKEQQERVEEAGHGLEQTRRLVEENMLVAWSALKTARNRLVPLNAHVVAADQTRNAYKSQFDLGQRTLLDLLDSEVESFNARSALINAKFEVDLAAYEVLAHTGDLVDTVSTQLVQK
jgi:adhesin transport system outer membrane protein